MAEEKKDSQETIDPLTGKPIVKPADNPTIEDLKNLQKVVSEKDRLLKEAEAKLAEVKKNDDDKRSEVEKTIDGFKSQIGELTAEIKKVQVEKSRAELAKTYPDILPELLLGKNDEEVKTIVEKQRTLSKKVFGDSQFFSQPTYKDVSAVDAAIEAVKNDSSLTTAKKLERIRDLKFQRDQI